MTAAEGAPWRTTGNTVTLRVRLTPKGGKDSIDGLTETPDGRAIKARVRAAPEDNAANDALTVLIAGWLGVPKRDVTLVGGHKSRTKSVRIAGDPAALQARLRSLAERLEP